MSWRQKFVAKILLLLCRMFTDDPDIRHELKNLFNHVSVAKEIPLEETS